LEDEGEIARNLLTKLSEYALGREMNYSDSEMIHRLLEASKNNDYKFRDLMVGIIDSSHSAFRPVDIKIGG
jgi:hypothetical protein